ncbi:MAG: hypothetical protein JNJ94_12220 [Chlorobi bacterium]|nr:hypothetical protein [Chlorobiota bacterium]
MRITTTLKKEESDFVASITPEGERPEAVAKALLQALLSLASQKPRVLSAAAQKMAVGVKVQTPERKRLTADDYRKALQQSNSNITQAAAALGVNPSTVRGMAIRHNIPVQVGSGRRASTGYKAMTPEERRAYNREAKRREKERKQDKQKTQKTE